MDNSQLRNALLLSSESSNPDLSEIYRLLTLLINSLYGTDLPLDDEIKLLEERLRFMTLYGKASVYINDLLSKEPLFPCLNTWSATGLNQYLKSLTPNSVKNWMPNIKHFHILLGPRIQGINKYSETLLFVISNDEASDLINGLRVKNKSFSNKYQQQQVEVLPITKPNNHISSRQIYSHAEMSSDSDVSIITLPDPNLPKNRRRKRLDYNAVQNNDNDRSNIANVNNRMKKTVNSEDLSFIQSNTTSSTYPFADYQSFYKSSNSQIRQYYNNINSVSKTTQPLPIKDNYYESIPDGSTLQIEINIVPKGSNTNKSNTKNLSQNKDKKQSKTPIYDGRPVNYNIKCSIFPNVQHLGTSLSSKSNNTIIYNKTIPLTLNQLILLDFTSIHKYCWNVNSTLPSSKIGQLSQATIGVNDIGRSVSLALYSLTMSLEIAPPILNEIISSYSSDYDPTLAVSSPPFIANTIEESTIPLVTVILESDKNSLVSSKDIIKFENPIGNLNQTLDLAVSKINYSRMGLLLGMHLSFLQEGITVNPTTDLPYAGNSILTTIIDGVSGNMTTIVRLIQNMVFYKTVPLKIETPSALVIAKTTPPSWKDKLVSYTWQPGDRPNTASYDWFQYNYNYNTTHEFPVEKWTLNLSYIGTGLDKALPQRIEILRSEGYVIYLVVTRNQPSLSLINPLAGYQQNNRYAPWQVDISQFRSVGNKGDTWTFKVGTSTSGQEGNTNYIARANIDSSGITTGSIITPEITNIQCLILADSSLTDLSLDTAFDNVVNLDVFIPGVIESTLTFSDWTSIEVIDEGGKRRYGLQASPNGIWKNSAAWMGITMNVVPNGITDRDLAVLWTGALTYKEEDDPISGQKNWQFFPSDPQISNVIPGFNGDIGKSKITTILTPTFGNTENQTIPMKFQNIDCTWNVELDSNSENIRIFQGCNRNLIKNDDVRDAIWKQTIAEGCAAVESNISGIYHHTVRLKNASMGIRISATEKGPQSAFTWDIGQDVLAFALGIVADVALNAEKLAESNKVRIDALEHAMDLQNAFALAQVGLDLFSALGGFGFVARGISRIIQLGSKGFNNIASRLIGTSLSGSDFAYTLLNLFASRKEIFENIGSTLSEFMAKVKALGKKIPIIEQTAGKDWFRKDLNYVFADGSEFLKYGVSVSHNYASDMVKIMDPQELVYAVNKITDTGAPTLSVMHRPLQFLPAGLRDIVAQVSYGGLQSGDLAATRRFLENTTHPTHSYVILEHEYPDIDRGEMVRSVTISGIGEPNSFRGPASDKNAGIGSLTTEYTILGRDTITGERIEKPRRYVMVGYTDDEVRSFYFTAFGKEFSGTDLDDAWDEINAIPRSRIASDTMIASSSVTIDRTIRLHELMNARDDWGYRLIGKNCQDYAHGLLDYVETGKQPFWVQDHRMDSHNANVVSSMRALVTWPDSHLNNSFIEADLSGRRIIGTSSSTSTYSLSTRGKAKYATTALR